MVMNKATVNARLPNKLLQNRAIQKVLIRCRPLVNGLVYGEYQHTNILIHARLDMNAECNP